MNLQSNPGNRLIINECNSGNLVQRDSCSSICCCNSIRAIYLGWKTPNWILEHSVFLPASRRSRVGFLGAFPSIIATRINLAEFLKRGGMHGIVGDRRWARKALTIGQIALVVVLLTGAGLFLRSYAKVLAVPRGFDPSTVAVSIQFSPSTPRCPGIRDMTAPKNGDCFLRKYWRSSNTLRVCGPQDWLISFR